MTSTEQVQAEPDTPRPFEKVVKKSRKVTKPNSRKMGTAFLARKEREQPIRRTFKGLDVYVTWNRSAEYLSLSLNRATSWTPFQLVDVIESDTPDLLDGTGERPSEWLCRFKFDGDASQAIPYVTSLLDSVEQVAPWTLSEKVIEETDDPLGFEARSCNKHQLSARDRPILRAPEPPPHPQ